MTMTSPYELLLSGIRLGPLPLRNRLVMGAMHTRLEHDVAAYSAFLKARAAGGVSLIITGGHAPTSEGRIDDSAPVMNIDSDTEPHRAFCSVVHAHGAALGMQLLHAGRYADLEQSVAPSAVAWGSRRAPRELQTREITDLIDSFAQSAARARLAGYDAVEIMGSEGYLVHQFAARRTNQRTDAYGGSWEARRRFPVEVVRAVREAIGPGVALIFRISAADLLSDGLTQEEVEDLARAVVEAGVDALDTGIGWHESPVPTVSATVPRTAWAKYTRRLRAAVDVPVIAANRINTAHDAERLLHEGVADLVALARPLLADPEFLLKIEGGLDDQINTCVACNQSCLDRVLEGRPVRCLVNPTTGRESRPRPRADRRHDVCVVGAGPAGLSCALTLAEDGHRVTLYEGSPFLGGQLRLAMVVPGKEEFAAYIDYARQRLSRLGVTVHLGSTVSADELLDGGFEHLFIATGLRPRLPELPVLDDGFVVTYDEVLRGEREVGQRVAILGAGGVGFDTALYLTGDPTMSQDAAVFERYWAATGQRVSRTGTPRQVTMFRRTPGRIGGSLGRSTGWILKRQLQRAEVTMISGVTYGHASDGHFSYVDQDHLAHTLPVDQVILCTGQVSRSELFESLRDRHPSVHVVGGARDSRGMDAARAIREGFDAAQEVGGSAESSLAVTTTRTIPGGRDSSAASASGAESRGNE